MYVGAICYTNRVILLHSGKFYYIGCGTKERYFSGRLVAGKTSSETKEMCVISSVISSVICFDTMVTAENSLLKGYLAC